MNGSQRRQRGERRWIGGGAGRAWWLWEWLWGWVEAIRLVRDSLTAGKTLRPEMKTVLKAYLYASIAKRQPQWRHVLSGINKSMTWRTS